MAKTTTFFLGANSANGFYSLYDQLGQEKETRDFMILKGGPGVGKSTFMKYIGRRAEEKGLDVEYIRCSGDPNSLDAVRIPALQTAVADGTAPHVLEPSYPAAVDRYLNLGCFYDVDRLKERRWEIIACTKGYQAEYRKAYTCLHAAGAVRAEMEEGVQEACDLQKLERRVQNAWVRERGRRRAQNGKQTRRFLGGLTAQGRVWCTDSLYTLCNHIYELQDTYHLGAPALVRLSRTILCDGYDLLTCMDPDDPERISHLLVPELKVAFVTTDRRFALEKKPYRRMRLDQLSAVAHDRHFRGGLRLKERLAEELESEGVAHLRAAGEKHDDLEQIYHPFVDFNGVLAAAEKECRRIFREA